MRRNQEILINEYRKEILPNVTQNELITNGQLFFLQKTMLSEFDRTCILWILQAHKGSLEKLNMFFRREGIYETFEILAIARNIFENLVWLKLMNEDKEYGIAFYSLLLKNQRENNTSMISQSLSEAKLFDEMDELDTSTLAPLINIATGEPSDEEIKTAQEEHRARQHLLDDMVRREFCLFASSAIVNGYGYQAHLIRSNIVPEIEQRNSILLDSEEKLVPILALLTSKKVKQALSHWNWAVQAELVGMKRHYEVLYRFTSKLLHATPMNLITEKRLDASEEEMLLDYIVISAQDILSEIRNFNYPGQVKVPIFAVE